MTPFSVKLSQLWSPRWKVEETNADISAGRLSRTKEPLTLSKMGRGRYFVINGNHRAQEALMAGMTTYPAVLDEFTPDMERTAGAHRSAIESAVPIAATILKPNPPRRRRTPLAGALAFHGLRPTRQESPYTCGPASLQCVAAFTGRRPTEAQLAAALGTTKRHGTTPAQLRAGAAKLGLRPTMCRRMSAVALLMALKRGRPIIVLWNDHGAHWSVVVGVHAKRRSLVLADPWRQSGMRLVRIADFKRHWRTTVAGRRYVGLGIVCRP